MHLPSYQSPIDGYNQNSYNMKAETLMRLDSYISDNKLGSPDTVEGVAARWGQRVTSMHRQKDSNGTTGKGEDMNVSSNNLNPPTVDYYNVDIYRDRSKSSGMIARDTSQMRPSGGKYFEQAMNFTENLRAADTCAGGPAKGLLNKNENPMFAASNLPNNNIVTKSAQRDALHSTSPYKQPYLINPGQCQPQPAPIKFEPYKNIPDKKPLTQINPCDFLWAGSKSGGSSSQKKIGQVAPFIPDIKSEMKNFDFTNNNMITDALHNRSDIHNMSNEMDKLNSANVIERLKVEQESERYLIDTLTNRLLTSESRNNSLVKTLKEV
jgi:hypothetical protein